MTASRAAEVASLIESLASGSEPSDAMVTVLSDLDRDAVAAVMSRWADIPSETRMAVLAHAVSLATGRVDVEFTRLGLIALDDESPTVRQLAAAALSENGGPEVARRLARAIERDDDPDVLAAAADAATPYVLDFEMGRLDPEAGSLLVESLRRRLHLGDMPLHTRAAFVGAVAPLEAEWVDEFIRDAYYSDDRGLRLAALGAMGQSASDAWLDFLEEELLSEDSDFRRRAAEAAGMIASEVAVDMLAPLLDDDDPDVVAAALYAFAEIGGPEAVAFLEEFEERVPEGLESLLQDAAESARTGFVTMRPPGER